LQGFGYSAEVVWPRHPFGHQTEFCGVTAVDTLGKPRVRRQGCAGHNSAETFTC
jgi:hypothetical protein